MILGGSMKVVVIDKSQDYVNRIKVSLENVSGKTVLVYEFVSDAANIEEIKNIDPDIVLKGCDVLVDKNALDCAVVSLVDDEKDVQKYSVFKWQSVQDIYNRLVEIQKQEKLEQQQQMMSIAVQNPSSSHSAKGKIVLVMGAASKSGNSMAALGLAQKSANAGKKVLFLNWREFNSHAYFQQVNTRADLKDVIYSVKKREGNINNIISNSLCMDKSHICYFHNMAQWNDECRITALDIEELLQVIISRREFDFIVVDTVISNNEMDQVLCKYADYIIFTTDGKLRSNQNIMLGFQYLLNVNVTNLKNKSVVLYTAFHNQNSQMLNNPPARVLGGIPLYDNKKMDEIVQSISNMEIFNIIM